MTNRFIFITNFSWKGTNIFILLQCVFHVHLSVILVYVYYYCNFVKKIDIYLCF